MQMKNTRIKKGSGGRFLGPDIILRIRISVSFADPDSRVEKVYLNHSLYISHIGGAELMATLCEDFSKVNNQSTVFEGRFPKYDNEIALAGKYASETGYFRGSEGSNRG